ncbi:hypothetical protein L484_023740 [Morus notabilis]|uniref:Uncharacterized protein n=1 Tax=Morus notabilis TaxID=981085 RepID=W9QYJ8_9ROSA|nr:hypothetical protein L484_023740 [Morus notabilis]
MGPELYTDDAGSGDFCEEKRKTPAGLRGVIRRALRLLIVLWTLFVYTPRVHRNKNHDNWRSDNEVPTRTVTPVIAFEMAMAALATVPTKDTNCEKGEKEKNMGSTSKFGISRCKYRESDLPINLLFSALVSEVDLQVNPESIDSACDTALPINLEFTGHVWIYWQIKDLLANQGFIGSWHM